MPAVFAGGLVVLWLGAQWMVKGATGLALRMGVRPIVVGLTIVAFGTSAPELVVSVIAAAADSPAVAIGNVIGSNIANVGLILGVTAFIVPITGDRTFLRMDMPRLFIAFLILVLVSLDGIISRLDALALLLALVVFVGLTYKEAGKRGGVEQDKTHMREVSALRDFFYTLFGLAALTAGARLMVWSAVGMAEKFGVSEAVIGATIVAIGTSLPEMATSLAAVMKKQHDIGLGNVIGSNVFNICSILGVAPLVRPLPVTRHLLTYEYPIMIGFSAALALMLMKRSNRITRGEGAVLFTAFIVFLVWAFYSGQQI